MTRNSSANDLGQIDLRDAAGAPNETEKGLVGGTFRLDAMSPGSAADASEMSAPRKTGATQAAFFAVLIVAAGGVVYGMRQMGIGPLKSFGAIKAPEYDVTKGVSVANSDHQRVLRELSAAALTAQVPPEQVQKNPFRLADALGPAPGDDDAKRSEAQRRAAEEKTRKEAEARKRQIETRLTQLKINSIMTGARPMARVGDSMVRVGDTIEELFKVKAINNRSIEVEADGVTYLLSLDEEPSRKGAPRTQRKR
ncbi:MAG: hypothetical protein KF768_01955 [Phycisphaeraceae bacterium]|nr:hypothetical protein [Phycisphaeraceae bacterium]